MDGEEADLDTDQDVFVDADALWTCDLRHREFKDSEQKNRSNARGRWKGIIAWSVGMAAILLAFAGIKIMGVKLEDKKLLSQKWQPKYHLSLSPKLLENCVRIS